MADTTTPLSKLNAISNALNNAQPLVEATKEYYSLEKDISVCLKDRVNILNTIYGSHKDITKSLGYMFNRQKELGDLIKKSTEDGVKEQRKLKSMEAGAAQRAVEITVKSIAQRQKMYELELELLDKINKLGMIPFIYLAGKLFNLFKQIDKAAYDFRMTMGMTRDTAGVIYKMSRSIAVEFMGIGVTIEGVYKSIVALGTEMGSIGLVTEDLAENVSILKSQLGIAEEDSAGFLRNMAAVSNSTMESQKNMAYVAGYMANAAGVPLPLIMKDIAKMSDVTLSLVSKFPIQIIKAAVEARRLNTTLNDMAKSSATILNFTTNIQDEMEASVLLGQALNLQKARELAYNGKLAESTQEIVRIAKDLDFSHMDYFQMNAFAKATGRSVEELNKMIQADEEWKHALRSNDPLVMKQVAAIQAMRQASEKTVLSESDRLRISVRNIANQERIAAITNKWNELLAKIGEVLLPTINAVLFGIQWVMESGVLTLIKLGAWAYAGYKTLRLIDATVVGMRTMSFALGLPAAIKELGIIKSLTSGWNFSSWFSGGKKPVTSAIAGAAASIAPGSQAGGMATNMVGLSTTLNSFGTSVMKQAAINLVIVGAALIPFSAGVWILSKSVSGIGLAIGGMFSMVGVLAIIGTIPKDKLISGAIALAIVGAALIPFAYGVSLLKGIDWQSMVVAGLTIVGLTAAVMGLGAIIATGFGAIAFGLGVAGFTALGVSLAVFGIAAKDAGEGMKNISNGFTDLSKLSYTTTIEHITKLINAMKALVAQVESMPKLDLKPLEYSMGNIYGTVWKTQPNSTNVVNSSNQPQSTVITNSDDTLLMTEKTGQKLCTLLDELGKDLKGGKIRVNIDGNSFNRGFDQSISWFGR